MFLFFVFQEAQHQYEPTTAPAIAAAGESFKDAPFDAAPAAPSGERDSHEKFLPMKII